MANGNAYHAHRPPALHCSPGVFSAEDSEDGDPLSPFREDEGFISLAEPRKPPPMQETQRPVALVAAPKREPALAAGTTATTDGRAQAMAQLMDHQMEVAARVRAAAAASAAASERASAAADAGREDDGDDESERRRERLRERVRAVLSDEEKVPPPPAAPAAPAPCLPYPRMHARRPARPDPAGGGPYAGHALHWC